MRLLISAITDPPTFQKLLAAIEEIGCQVIELRQSRFGEPVLFYLLVEGPWGAIVRLENLLPSLEMRHIFYERLEETKENGKGRLLYYVDIIAHPTRPVLKSALLFFHERGVEIQDLRVSSYPLPYLDQKATLIHLLVALPPHLSVVALRDEFLDLCDRLQIDGIFEPVKPVL